MAVQINQRSYDEGAGSGFGYAYIDDTRILWTLEDGKLRLTEARGNWPEPTTGQIQEVTAVLTQHYGLG